MSVPFCVIGSAAMKITSSTSSTSMSGVTFMSAVGVRHLGRDDLVGAEVMMCVRHQLPPAPASPGFLRVSVIRPTFSICASWSWSIIVMTAP